MFLLDCPTYEDYLDTYITRNDIRFIRNVRFCRMLVELGYRSTAELYTPEQFEKHKSAVLESLWPTKKSTIYFSDKLKIADPVLIELALREKANIQKNVSVREDNRISIVFSYAQAVGKNILKNFPLLIPQYGQIVCLRTETV